VPQQDCALANDAAAKGTARTASLKSARRAPCAFSGAASALTVSASLAVSTFMVSGSKWEFSEGSLIVISSSVLTAS
jgi:hypothetical protein